MRRIFLTLVLLTLSGQSIAAQAAPLWIERKFIPVPELVDLRFKAASAVQSVAVDHSLWKAFLSQHVEPGADGVNRVRYGAVTPEARASLDQYIAANEALDTAMLTGDQQLAYWINLYNAATVRLILDQYPTSSIRKVKVDGKGPWDHPVVTVLGQSLSLGDIEHHIVRALFPDPRVHYALNCASIGCPNLAAKPYGAAELEDMLDAAAKAYVNHPRGVQVRKNKADISKIYGWYREDFGDTREAVLAHLRKHAVGALAQDLAQVTKIGRYDYNWALNDASGQNQN